MTHNRWRLYSGHTLREFEKGFPVSVARVNALISIGRGMVGRMSEMNRDKELLDGLSGLKKELENS